MILNKKTTMTTPWARKKSYEYQGTQYEADIKNNDIVTILNSGTIIEGQFGAQEAFAIKTRNGDKTISLNQVTQNNLIESFGEDTENWKGKDVKVHIIKAMIKGKLQPCVYLAEPSWEMDDDGDFLPPTGKGKVKKSVDDGAASDEDLDDIDLENL